MLWLEVVIRCIGSSSSENENIRQNTHRYLLVGKRCRGNRNGLRSQSWTCSKRYCLPDLAYSFQSRRFQLSDKSRSEQPQAANEDETQAPVKRNAAQATWEPLLCTTKNWLDDSCQSFATSPHGLVGNDESKSDSMFLVVCRIEQKKSFLHKAVHGKPYPDWSFAIPPGANQNE